MKKNKGVFISWSKEGSRRTEHLAKFLNFEIFRFSLFPRKLIFSIIKFPIQFFKTIIYLFKTKPEIVIIEFCQPIIGLSSFIYKYFYGKKIIVDMHSGPFVSKKWQFFKPITHFVLKNSDLILIHDETIKEKLIFEKNKKIVVLHDPIFFKKSPSLNNKEYFVFPASWDKDEPIKEIIKASFLLKNIEIFITGKKRIKIHEVPQNLKFTGFLPDEDFYNLLKNSKGIISLTKWDYTLTFASFEAINLEKPLIVSNKKSFRKFFGDSVIYVENEPYSIAEGIKNLILNYDFYLNKIKDFKKKFLFVWEKEMELFKREISFL
jgi:hypothetical protein